MHVRSHLQLTLKYQNKGVKVWVKVNFLLFFYVQTWGMNIHFRVWFDMYVYKHANFTIEKYFFRYSYGKIFYSQSVSNSTLSSSIWCWKKENYLFEKMKCHFRKIWHFFLLKMRKKRQNGIFLSWVESEKCGILCFSLIHFVSLRPRRANFSLHKNNALSVYY